MNMLQLDGSYGPPRSHTKNKLDASPKDNSSPIAAYD